MKGGRITFKRRKDEDGEAREGEYDVYLDGEKVDGHVRKGSAPNGYYNSWQTCFHGSHPTDSRRDAGKALVALAAARNIDRSDSEYPICRACGHVQNTDEVADCTCQSVGCSCQSTQWMRS